jgi:hypothetical protein
MQKTKKALAKYGLISNFDAVNCDKGLKTRLNQQNYI